MIIKKNCEICGKEIIIYRGDYENADFHIGLFNGDERLYWCSWDCIEKFIEDEN